MEDGVLKERLELALERGGLDGAALAQGKPLGATVFDLIAIQYDVAGNGMRIHNYT